MQDVGTTGLHGQVEFDYSKAFLVQANLPDELVRARETEKKREIDKELINYINEAYERNQK